VRLVYKVSAVSNDVDGWLVHCFVVIELDSREHHRQRLTRALMLDNQPLLTSRFQRATMNRFYCFNLRVARSDLRRRPGLALSIEREIIDDRQEA
jgi:hypothetical protein